MSGMWKVLAFYCILLIPPGCMEAKWLAQQMEEYDKKQKQGTQTGQGVEKGTEFSEKLEKLPEGIQFPPDSLKGKVSYDAERHFMTCKGVMKEEEKNALLKLSEDPSYQEAIKRLYLSSLPVGSGKAVEIPVVSVPTHTTEEKSPALEKPAGPQVVLRDGNVIKGIVKGDITFQTELGTFKVKGEYILSLLEGTLRLKDGTILQGKIQQESLLIQTDYGELEVKTESIANITSE